ncbi:replication-relaxation family protein [Streptomyces prasinus]
MGGEKHTARQAHHEKAREDLERAVEADPEDLSSTFEMLMLDTVAVPTKTSEVRLFELDNGTMSRARLAKEVWDYERYAGHRVWEGACGTNGSTYPFWQRHRYTRSERFPRLHVVLAGKAEHLLDNRRKALTADLQGIPVAVWANALPRLKRGEPWYEIGVDAPHRRRARYPKPTGR